MNRTEIDDALRTDGPIEPSAEFRAKVMRAVHARAAAGRRHDSWSRAVWPTLGAGSVVVALLIAEMLLQRSAVRPGEMNEVIGWLSVTLTGTFALACRSTRRSA